jgi:flagellar export protein FliJ
MSARVHPDDRGLEAVRRVRTAREADSRTGLQLALAESRSLTDRAARAQQQVADAPGFAAGAAGDFLAHRRHLEALAERRRVAAAEAEAAARLAEEARGRWLADRTRVRVTDLLLERRADLRSQERARREAADLDDLAATGWLRRRTSEQQESR